MYPQLKLAAGYDHCWVVAGEGNTLKQAAIVEEPTSGRRLEVFSTAPGIQFYSGNYLGTGQNPGVHDFKYRQGLCLEPQDFPDAPNRSDYPSTALVIGETYRHDIEYRISLMEKAAIR